MTFWPRTLEMLASTGGATDHVSETGRVRRVAWWEREALRPPGAEVTRWLVTPADGGDVEAAQDRVLSALAGAPAAVETMSDRDAYYWGFHWEEPEDRVWVVGAAYDLPGEHAGRAGVRVLLTAGDKAELVTPLHSPEWPLDVPAARVAGESGVPVGELPGLWFSVSELGGADASGFRLIREL